MENDMSCKTNQKVARMAILVSDKVSFITRNRHFILIKGSINEKDIELLNMYSPNNTASKYVKPKLI